MDRDTPRLVYKWFFFIYRVCYGLAASVSVLFVCSTVYAIALSW
jgi:hypothetical protein|eukprot:COSAG02_NODE_7362_length_3047_cov_4.165875_4_plen_44_part_00